MATTNKPINIPPNTWVDVYAALIADGVSVSVGDQLIIQNNGNNSVQLTESNSEPDNSSGFNRLMPNNYAINAASNIGAWAKSGGGTNLQIEVSA